MTSPVENSAIDGDSGSRSAGLRSFRSDRNSCGDLYLRASNSFLRSGRRTRIGGSESVSVPLATTTSPCPARIKSMPDVTAWLLEMQACVTVCAGTVSGMPAARADSRATLLVSTSCTTVPIMTRSMVEALSPVRISSPFSAMRPMSYAIRSTYPVPER